MVSAAPVVQPASKAHCDLQRLPAGVVGGDRRVQGVEARFPVTGPLVWHDLLRTRRARVAEEHRKAPDGSANSDRTEVTDLLHAWRAGDERAEELLFDRVYGELRRIAGAQVRAHVATLAPTELVHEVYLKMLGRRPSVADREHFYSLAARAMRHVLVDSARRRKAVKRGGGAVDGDFDLALVQVVGDDGNLDLVALDEALGQLEALNPRLVRLVELRHFAGLSVEETARELKVSTRTVKRDWRTARAFLFDRIGAASDRSAASASER